MASWFLSFVIVHDLQTREKFYFLCNKWLAVDEEDGSINRFLSAAGDAQKAEFKYLFIKQTKQKFSDSHMWFSIFAKPAHSSFTRTERLTCCFVLLFISMLTNIMYYKSDNGNPDPNTILIGPIKISPSQVILFHFFFI